MGEGFGAVVFGWVHLVAALRFTVAVVNTLLYVVEILLADETDVAR